MAKNRDQSEIDKTTLKKTVPDKLHSCYLTCEL